MAADDQFVLWVSGTNAGIVAYGHFTDGASHGTADAAYWADEPGEKDYVPLEVDQWLERPVLKSQLAADPRMAGATILTMPGGRNPHKLTDVQWEAISEAIGLVQGGDVGRDRMPGGGSPSQATDSLIRAAAAPVSVETIRTVRGAIGQTYVAPDEGMTPTSGAPSVPDPDLVGRNLSAHRRLQNRLAEAARAHGYIALSPGTLDPDFDLALLSADGRVTVCEVKSLTSANETRQLRTGLGQILDYQDQLTARAPQVSAVLWVEREPSERRWVDLCRRVGVTLAWPGQEDSVLCG
ncbi:hypothetical protein [Streptomyces sp. NPDC086766]|uniref:hypothetical protein n=1 Tax=Streptomyces sp. NPDC086766 TaxID=3365754 RepID=UPI0038102C25